MGIEYFSQFLSSVIDLLQSPETSLNVFSLFQEISQNSLQIPFEILLIFSQFLDASNPYHFQALSIIMNSMVYSSSWNIEDLVNFTCQNILPKIFESSTLYDLDSLSISAIISINAYVHNPDSLIGDFIANCLTIDSSDFEERIISTLFEKEEWITPHPPIILALISKLQIPDEDASLYGRCSMSLSILYSMYENEPDILNEMMPQIISNINSTEPLNLGFLLRCVSIVIGVNEVSETFLPIVFNEINSCGIERGEACLCLARYCEFNQSECNEAFQSILPLLADSDLNVRNQSIISIQSILNVIEDFQPNNEYLLFLIDLFGKMDKDYQNIYSITDLICFYLKNSSELQFDEVIQTFFSNSIEFVLKESPSHCLFTSFAAIVTMFIYKLPSFDDFPSIFDGLIQKISPIILEIVTSGQENQNQIVDSEIEDLYTYLDLLNAIVSSNILNDSQIEQILRIVMELLKLEIHSQITIQIAIEISLKIFQTHWTEISSCDDIVSFFFNILNKYFSRKNLEIASLTVQILNLMLPKMPFEHMQLFLRKCFFCTQTDGNKNTLIYEFGNVLFTTLVQNQQPIDEAISELFLPKIDESSQ